jgi:hypothetical protein
VAAAQTVEAVDATAGVYHMVLTVDTGGFTLGRTYTAHIAFVGVYPDLEQGEFAEKSQNSSHRANCVAIGTSVFPCKVADTQKCHNGYNKGEDAHNHYIGFVERIIAETGEYGFQYIVAGHIDRSEYIGDYSTECTVWIDKSQQSRYLKEECDNHNSQNRPTQDVLGLAEFVPLSFFSGLLRYPCYDVLIDTHRAYR